VSSANNIQNIENMYIRAHVLDSFGSILHVSDEAIIVTHYCKMNAVKTANINKTRKGEVTLSCHTALPHSTVSLSSQK